MSVIEKSEILSLVAGSGLSRRRALAQLGLAKSTYYRWLRRQTGGSLQDRKGGSPIPWNKLVNVKRKYTQCDGWKCTHPFPDQTSSVE